MTSTSKSNQRKPKKSKFVPKKSKFVPNKPKFVPNKSKFVPKPKQQWQEKEQKRDWLEVPSDVMVDILYRVGVYDIIENAQKVCTTWRTICKDPAMWRVINMDSNYRKPNDYPSLLDLCKQAVDRSQGQLVDITVSDLDYEELLEYIADRSSQLRRLSIRYCESDILESWTKPLKKFPLLEELSLYKTDISKEAIKTIGRYCPMLRTLKVNDAPRDLGDYDSDVFLVFRNEIAIAIGKNLSELRHLELIGNNMTNAGLKAILDGCHNLELLDLRRCMSLDLNGDMGKTCLEKVKCLKLPNDSLEDYLYLNRNDNLDSNYDWHPRRYELDEGDYYYDCDYD